MPVDNRVGDPNRKATTPEGIIQEGSMGKPENQSWQQKVQPAHLANLDTPSSSGVGNAPLKNQTNNQPKNEATPAVDAIQKKMQEKLNNSAGVGVNKEKEPGKDKGKEKNINPDR